MKMLIIARAHDAHAQAIVKEFSANPLLNIYVLDARYMYEDWSIVCKIQQNSSLKFSVLYHGEEIANERNLLCIWNRQIRSQYGFLDLDDSFSSYVNCANERDKIAGLFSALTSLQHEGHFIIHAPVYEFMALDKVLQLRLAEQVGFSIPRTVIGRVRDYEVCAKAGEARREVVKRINSSGYSYKSYTSLYHPTHPSIKNKFPEILQHHVSGKDVRVTVVGDELISVKIQKRQAESVDWRADSSWVEIFDLPDHISEAVFKLVRSLKLEICALDLLLDDCGIYYFLELNLTPQFLFINSVLGINVAGSVANMILHKGVQCMKDRCRS